MAAYGLKSRVGAAWENTLLICAKCSKRMDGGFGPKGRTPLAKALRKHLGLKKGRKASLGIVEVKCLGVCPRGAVTVVNGAAPRRVGAGSRRSGYGSSRNRPGIGWDRV